MLSWVESVPIIDVLILRRLFDIVQSLLLNPFLVRSPATMILMLSSPAPGLMLIGTLCLPL